MCVAGVVEFGHLFFGEIPADRTEVLAELLFVAGAHDDVDDGGTLEQPVERDLRDGFSGFFRDFVESVHNFVEIFIRHLRAVGCGFVEARNFRNGLIAANFAGEASPPKRAPDERADFLVERERRQFPFIFAADERVVDLMADLAGPTTAL